MELEKFKAKHLFLVIGTNPLPNYVAAKLLAKEEPVIYMIHSREVEDVCANLTLLLRKEGVSSIINIEVEEGYPDKIYQKILNTIKDLRLEDVGINYTGGTKAMSVHSYRAVKKIIPDAFFYYLDAGSMTFQVERNGSVYSTGWVRDHFRMNIAQLIALHGYKFEDKHLLITTPEFPEMAKNIANSDVIQFRKWCSANLRTDRGVIDKPNILWEISLPTFDESIISAWSGCKTFGELADKNGIQKKDAEKLSKYLDGLWLEDYTLECLINISKKSKTKISTGRSLEVVKEVKNTKGDTTERKFELDDFCLIGYQLFGIACGTAYRKGDLKTKLFEVMLRSAQLGGDEARFALVCNNEKPYQIEDEVNNIWDTGGKLTVFGRDDLPDLENKLFEWFKKQPGGMLS